MKKKDFAPIISLFLICVCVTGLVSLTYVATKDTISKRALDDATKAMNIVLPGSTGFTDITEEVIEKNVDVPATVNSVYVSDKGYVFTLTTSGYGGDILVYVGVNNEGSVVNIQLGANEETPSLGKKAKEAFFTDQFAGLTGEDVIKDEIDHISGASYTTNAVIEAVESALTLYSEVSK
ncbi:MAG: FMN-binding protein [Clostridia bacterium]